MRKNNLDREPERNSPADEKPSRVRKSKQRTKKPTTGERMAVKMLNLEDMRRSDRKPYEGEYWPTFSVSEAAAICDSSCTGWTKACGDLFIENARRLLARRIDRAIERAWNKGYKAAMDYERERRSNP